MSQTAKELALQAKEAKPSVAYGYSTDDTAVGVLKDNIWVIVANRILTGGWANMPVQLLINGECMADSMEIVAV